MLGAYHRLGESEMSGLVCARIALSLGMVIVDDDHLMMVIIKLGSSQ